MQLTEQFDLRFPRAVVWAAFQNLRLLVECLPGASLTSPADQVPLGMTFQLKMGPVVAAFAGQGDVTYEPASFSGNFHGQGIDRKNNSRVKGEARFTLLETAVAVTTVHVLVDFTLTGALAQFSRLGIVREIAAAITTQFAGNLQRELACIGREVGELSGGLVVAAAPVEPLGKSATSLSLQALLWQLLVKRFRSLFNS